MNGGVNAGVACFKTDHAKGLTPVGGLRRINNNESTPPIGPPNTVSDIVFNPSETALFVTVKGDGTDPGYIYVYPVLPDGKVSNWPIVSRPAGLLVDFSLNFLGNDWSAVISDPAYGVSLVDISPDFKVTVRDHIAIANQSAICWTAYAPRFDSVYAIDAGGANPTITVLEPSSGAVKYTIHGDAAEGGFLDSKVDRTWLYSLRGDPAVSVTSLSGSNSGKAPEIVQTLNLTSLGSRQGWQGLAIYPNSD